MSEQSRYVDRAGVYTCEVRKPAEGWFFESGEKGTLGISLACIVITEGDQNGKEISWTGWLTEKAVDNTIKALIKAFPSWNGDLQGLLKDEYSFEEMTCDITAETEFYEGKARVKARWLNPVGGNRKVVDSNKLSGLIKAINRKSMALAKTEKKAEPAKVASASVEDDIPY